MYLERKTIGGLFLMHHLNHTRHRKWVWSVYTLDAYESKCLSRKGSLTSDNNLLLLDASVDSVLFMFCFLVWRTEIHIWGSRSFSEPSLLDLRFNLCLKRCKIWPEIEGCYEVDLLDVILYCLTYDWKHFVGSPLTKSNQFILSVQVDEILSRHSWNTAFKTVGWADNLKT